MVRNSSEAMFAQCAALIRDSDGILIAAGAGMGVDSGLPDFRGPTGFWDVYPALGRSRMHFDDIANPRAFREAPRLAWGFYGHRLERGWLWKDTGDGDLCRCGRECGAG